MTRPVQIALAVAALVACFAIGAGVALLSKDDKACAAGKPCPIVTTTVPGPTTTVLGPTTTVTTTVPGPTTTVTQTETVTVTQPGTTTAPPAAVVWSADHETGDLSQWGDSSVTQDSGDCTRAVNGVHAIGNYAQALTVDTRLGTAGCRTFRREESQSGNTYVYEAKYFLPSVVYPTNNMWNVFQFKSRCDTCGQPNPTLQPDPMFTLGFERNPVRLTLNWKGGNYGLAGPFSNSGVVANQEWVSDTFIPIGQWTTLTVLQDQSTAFDGHFTAWLDGVQVFDFANVRTQYANGDSRWSVNNYSNGLSVNPYTLYIDDASIREP